MIMYNIYINNQSEVAAYVRLSSEKMQYSDSYVQRLEEEILKLGFRGGASSRAQATLLAIGGFCFISPQGTLPFPVENAATPLYISVVCVERNRVGLVSFSFDPRMYGCVSIKLYQHLLENPKIVLLPYNPKAVWIPAKTGDEFPKESAVEAGVGRNEEERFYFGRLYTCIPSHGGIPCAVTGSGNYGTWRVGANLGNTNGDLLKNTGCELLRANRGDRVPPNAVMTGVTQDGGSLFVGRVGGSIPCYITTEEGKIQRFVYGLDGKNLSVENGEVMVLTR